MAASGLVPGLRFVDGDLFASRCQTLVNQVCRFGTMGTGITLEFQRRFPAHYDHWRRLLPDWEWLPAEPFLTRDTGGPWIVGLPVQLHSTHPIFPFVVEHALGRLAHRVVEWGVESLALPALGCGRGGLDWASVRPLLERHLGGLSLPIEVYEPR